jgi:hypothetical protein
VEYLCISWSAWTTILATSRAQEQLVTKKAVKGSKLTAAERAKCVPNTFTPARQAQYLELLGAHGPRVASDTTGISWSTVYRKCKSDAEFKTKYEEAQEHLTSTLEHKAMELASSSDAKSCTMLIFMLKARRPEVYRERIEHTGKDGKPIGAMDADTRQSMIDEILLLTGQSVTKDKSNGASATH